MANPRSDVAATVSAPAVTTSSSTVLAARPGRVEVTIINNSDTDITLAPSTSPGVVATAVAGTGIVLKANGGSYTTTSYTGAFAAIHGGTGSKSLAIVEY